MQIKEASLLVGIIVGLITIFASLWGVFANLHQRKLELRWKQANLGRELVDQLLQSRRSSRALDMIELRKPQEFTNGEVGWIISEKDILDAFTLLPNDPKVRFIQRGFDALLYMLDRLQYFTVQGLVRLDDVRVPLEYYIQGMSPSLRVGLEAYAKLIRYPRAMALISALED